MYKRSYWSATIFTLIAQSFLGMSAAADESQTFESESRPSAVEQPTAPFDSFTGRITRNKVRMRLQPSLDAQILRELARDDLLIVIGESDEFYAVAPPKDSKAYVFRTFILDNKVEGNKVNVRLEPAIEAPVIAQLNSGEKIDGVVSTLNSKWLEITPPPSTRFYVCKEYVEKIGSPSVMAQIERRREEVNELLNRSYQLTQSELEKSYESIHIEPAIAGFNKIIKEYSDFSDQSARAKELLASLQETLLQRKVAYLEAKTKAQETALIENPNRNNSGTMKQTSTPQPTSNNPTTNPPKADDQPQYSFGSAMPTGAGATPDWNNLLDAKSMTGKMASWLPVEKALYDSWASEKDSPTPHEFYEEQMEDVITLTGILEPYSRSIKNKPGDFLLVSTVNSLPIAYLYSTSVNLQDKLGHVSTVHVIKRPNNNFAFPAYFVVSVE